MNRSESKYFNTARRMDEALLSLLEEKDFAYITVREICARAGVNRSTFYLHYENTSDLLRETVEMIDERFRASVADATDDKTGGERLAGLPREELFLLTDRRLLPYLDFIKRNARQRKIAALMHIVGQVGKLLLPPRLPKANCAEVGTLHNRVFSALNAQHNAVFNIRLTLHFSFANVAVFFIVANIIQFAAGTFSKAHHGTLRQIDFSLHYYAKGTFICQYLFS